MFFQFKKEDLEPVSVIDQLLKYFTDPHLKLATELRTRLELAETEEISPAHINAYAAANGKAIERLAQELKIIILLKTADIRDQMNMIRRQIAKCAVDVEVKTDADCIQIIEFLHDAALDSLTKSVIKCLNTNGTIKSKAAVKYVTESTRKKTFGNLPHAFLAAMQEDKPVDAFLQVLQPPR